MNAPERKSTIERFAAWIALAETDEAARYQLDALMEHQAGNLPEPSVDAAGTYTEEEQ